MGGDSNVVTVFSDCNKKYLSSDLMKQEPVRDHYETPHIELTGFKVLKRVCDTCCEMYQCDMQLHKAM
jgi:cysteine synthase A